MKAVFILPDLGAGGAERVVTILSKEMVHQGIPVDILLFLSDRVQYEVPEGVGLVKLNACSVSKIERISRLRTYFKEQCQLQQRLVALPFHDSCLKYALVAAKGQRVDVVACERNDPKQKGQKGIRKLSAVLPYALASRCVFQTEDAMEYYGKWVKRRSTIIKNPIMLPDDILWQGFLSKKIVSVGRLELQKNQKMLIDAFALVHSQLPEYTLDIYGEGSMRTVLQEKIDSYGLHEAITLQGIEKNIYQRLSEAALFVLPSDYEGMSNALMEALAIGLPTVSTDHPAGGARSLIENGKNGLLTPVGNKEAMAEAIVSLLRDPVYAQKMSAQSRKIRQQLASDVIAKQWVAWCLS